MFARMFDSPRYGQVLLVKDRASVFSTGMSIGGEIRYFFKPGVPAVQLEQFAMFFEDTVEGWQRCQTYLETITLEEVEAVIDEMLNETQDMVHIH